MFGFIRSIIKSITTAVLGIVDTLGWLFWTIGVIFGGVGGVLKVILVAGVQFIDAPITLDPYVIRNVSQWTAVEFEQSVMISMVTVGVLLSVVGPRYFALALLGLVPAIVLHATLNAQSALIAFAALLVVVILGLWYGSRLLDTLFALGGAWVGARVFAALVHGGPIYSMLNLQQFDLSREVELPLHGVKAIVQDSIELHDTVDAMLTHVIDSPSMRLVVKVAAASYQHWLILLCIAVGLHFVRRVDLIRVFMSPKAMQPSGLSVSDTLEMAHAELCGSTLISWYALLQSVFVYVCVAMASALSYNYYFSFGIASIVGSWMAAYAIANLLHLHSYHESIFISLLVARWLPEVFAALIQRRAASKANNANNNNTNNINNAVN